MRQHWKIETAELLSFGRGQVPEGAEVITREQYLSLRESVPEKSELPAEKEPEVSPLRVELDDIISRLRRLENQ